MIAESRYLVDTNILVRLSRVIDPQHQLVETAIDNLNLQGVELCFALQNIAEFWNVSTRPIERNGYGLSIDETNRRVNSIERIMTFLPDKDEVYSIWRRLVMVNNVRGVQVLDARLAAIMQAYGLTHILTLNQPDFLRYANIQAIHPSQVQHSAR